MFIPIGLLQHAIKYNRTPQSATPTTAPGLNGLLSGRQTLGAEGSSVCVREADGPLCECQEKLPPPC